MRSAMSMLVSWLPAVLVTRLLTAAAARAAPGSRQGFDRLERARLIRVQDGRGNSAPDHHAVAKSQRACNHQWNNESLHIILAVVAHGGVDVDHGCASCADTGVSGEHTL